MAGNTGPGSVLSLEGPLGSGKTTFTRGFVGHFGDAPVNSPSYTIAQVYPTRPPVAHLDFYRLTDPEEVEQLGLTDYFAPEFIALVEWGNRFPELLPKHHKTVRLAIDVDGTRRVDII
ncbi:MAG: tRNA (adenosine(37)-N6)-threonylcarbamoyltransferase complex ATPase subunit type 1 TsaE [Spirochaetota bacterium]